MATVLLSVGGAILGGPVGGALGAFIGQQIDQQIFKPKAREGARLQDLAVQTSQYGNQFPRVYGRMRMAGTVIWATDLRESEVRQGGGKGRPSTTSFAYSVSFAVALSSRPIQAIGRIWADGNIIRGTNGDFTIAANMRFYSGHGDQPVDPLIALIEGQGAAPAYRNLAYAVFDDMPLEEFGNRIPSLTFELIADNGAVFLTDILADIAPSQAAGGDDHGQQNADMPQKIDGIALSGASKRAAIETLSAGFAIDVVAAAPVLYLSLLENKAMDQPYIIARDDISFDPALNSAAVQMRRSAIGTVQQSLSLRYYDRDRDYQSGLRRASRHRSGPELSIDFPATLDASSAQERVDILFAFNTQRRDILTLRTMTVDRNMRPGRVVALEGRDEKWLVNSWSWVDDAINLEMSAFALPGARGLPTASAGRAVTSADFVASPSSFTVFDLPSEYDMPSDSPRIALGLSGADSGWRGAQIFGADAVGNPAEPLQFVRAGATIGASITALGGASALMLDRQNSVTVQLVNHKDTLLSATIDDVLAGANLAILGDELIQFCDARYLGDGKFTLSKLLRGRGGTEDQIERHAIGDAFLLLDDAVSFLNSGQARIGGPLALFAAGVGDGLPVAAARDTVGRAVLPLSVAQLRAHLHDDGSIALNWVRRSRAGFAWRDAVEVALAEATELYQISISAQSERLFMVQASTPQMTISHDIVSAAKANGHDVLTIAIAQLGANGRSALRALQIPI